MGKWAAYTITHARILLKADANQLDGGWRDQDIHAALDISVSTIERVRWRCVEEGLEATLRYRPGAGFSCRLDGEGEAHLIALRCGEPPEDRGR